MKKIIILIILINISKVNFAQIPITDTVGYLRDSISARRTYFIGKPLSILLNDLKIEVKSYTARVPFNSEQDTIIFAQTSLEFYDNNTLVAKYNHHIISPSIYIVFAMPIQIPKKYFEIGKVLDWTTGWTPQKAAFYGSYIISDLQVWGL